MNLGIELNAASKLGAVHGLRKLVNQQKRLDGFSDSTHPSWLCFPGSTESQAHLRFFRLPMTGLGSVRTRENLVREFVPRAVPH